MSWISSTAITNTSSFRDNVCATTQQTEVQQTERTGYKIEFQLNVERDQDQMT